MDFKPYEAPHPEPLLPNHAESYDEDAPGLIKKISMLARDMKNELLTEESLELVLLRMQGAIVAFQMQGSINVIGSVKRYNETGRMKMLVTIKDRTGQIWKVNLDLKHKDAKPPERSNDLKKSPRMRKGRLVRAK